MPFLTGYVILKNYISSLDKIDLCILIIYFSLKMKNHREGPTILTFLKICKKVGQDF